MTEHLDLDALADVLAGEPAPAHLAGCAECSADLDALRAADTDVRAALRSLDPPPLPDGLADRIDAALAREAREARGAAAGVTTLPTVLPTGQSRRSVRWLPAAAAAILLLGGAALGVTQLTRSGSSDNGRDDAATSAAGAAGGATEAALVRNSTGTDYTGRSDLAAAVPALLAGTAADRTLAAAAPQAAAGTAATGESDSALSSGSAGSAGTTRGAPPPAPAAAGADPLAGLRQDPGLAECLAALLPPEDPSVRPLALDYGSFKGRPAMVVVLPGSSEKHLDVFVVGPGCSRANDSVLFYASVPAS